MDLTGDDLARYVEDVDGDFDQSVQVELSNGGDASVS